MPYSCQKRSIPQKANCEEACTKHKPCVGYIYDEESGSCFLIPSSKSCPADYSTEESSITAASSNDLEAYEKPGMACYGKNIGNINMHTLNNSMLQLT